MHVAAKRAAAPAEEGGDGGGGAPMPVAEWLPSYGTDPYYPSRRIRRITERVYFKVNQARFMPRFDLSPSSRAVFLEVVVSICPPTPLVVAWWYHEKAVICVTVWRAGFQSFRISRWRFNRFSELCIWVNVHVFCGCFLIKNKPYLSCLSRCVLACRSTSCTFRGVEIRPTTAYVVMVHFCWFPLATSLCS